VTGVLAEVVAGVDQDAARVDAERHGALGLTDRAAQYVGHDVVIGHSVRAGARLDAAGVRADERGPVVGGHRRELGIPLWIGTARELPERRLGLGRNAPQPARRAAIVTDIVPARVERVGVAGDRFGPGLGFLLVRGVRGVPPALRDVTFHAVCLLAGAMHYPVRSLVCLIRPTGSVTRSTG
jgi:hypothetical protein